MSHWVEAMLLGVPFIAAVVYLVVEIFDFKIWWNKRKQVPPRLPSLGDTWPLEQQMKAEEEWSRMMEKTDENEAS